MIPIDPFPNCNYKGLWGRVWYPLLLTRTFYCDQKLHIPNFYPLMICNYSFQKVLLQFLYMTKKLLTSLIMPCQYMKSHLLTGDTFNLMPLAVVRLEDLVRGDKNVFQSSLYPTSQTTQYLNPIQGRYGVYPLLPTGPHLIRFCYQLSRTWATSQAQ